MKLWKISQTENTNYDTYDSAIVAAETEDEAKLMHPIEGESIIEMNHPSWGGDWVNDPAVVTAIFIGDAKEGTEKGVVLASFNAG